MPELKRLPATRIVATPAALDAASWPANARIFRFAPDELLVTPPVDNPGLDDPHAIVIADSSYAGVWLPKVEALAFLEQACEWELPAARPAFAQGSVAGIPTKLWFEADQVLFIIPAPYIVDFEERMI